MLSPPWTGHPAGAPPSQTQTHVRSMQLCTHTATAVQLLPATHRPAGLHIQKPLPYLCLLTFHKRSSSDYKLLNIRIKTVRSLISTWHFIQFYTPSTVERDYHLPTQPPCIPSPLYLNLLFLSSPFFLTFTLFSLKSPIISLQIHSCSDNTVWYNTCYP